MSPLCHDKRTTQLNPNALKISIDVADRRTLNFKNALRTIAKIPRRIP